MTSLREARATRPKRRLGWLGPIVVLVGAAVAGVAVWFVLRSRPVAGDVIDTIAIGPDAKLVVRAAKGNNNSFLELHERGALKWQAFIPRYAGAPGRPAVAWNDGAVTVRVDREGGRAEVFAFARANAHKLGMLRLAQHKEPIRIHAEGPITLTDHQRSFEIVTGADWGYLIAIDLAIGEGAWQAELGKGPITRGGVEGGRVWIEQSGKQRFFDAKTGAEQTGNSL